MTRAVRRVGVLGSFVWDRIYGRDLRSEPVEEWGGITYALGGMDAALCTPWQIVPIIKVGKDLEHRAREFLGTLRHVAAGAYPIAVDQPNNRVTLRYTEAERRSEVLSGGVPPWTWLGLRPLLDDLDALYINLISGFELDLLTAQLVRQHFHGPIFCDLHSLLLAVQPDGLRTPRPLPNAAEWMRCFDFVQVNEAEMALMASDSMALAAIAMNAGVQSLIVTLGSRGAVYFAAANFETLHDAHSARTRQRVDSALGTVRTALLPAAATDVKEGDPTGCGDVFGATYFSRLLCGDKFADALQLALRAAARNFAHRGATHLAFHLRGELGPS
ncbi:MAG TPA: carbohydrate kinase family protein [Gemmatimonadaceae bacterium]|nr:carbohydrate kinase family protein [Gemmatimonadaceae bacterium]